MTSIQKFIFFTLVIGVLSSCNESDSPTLSSKEYLIFGRFAGFCLGENCVQIFKLDSTELAEDLLDKYPSRTDFYEGEFSRLDDSKFEIASNLLIDFPRELLYETDTVFGCPDCADQGGYYLEVKTGDVHRFWILDTHRGNVPEYMPHYLDQIDEVIGKL